MSLVGSPVLRELCVVLHACNPRFGTVEAEGSEIQSHPWSGSHCEASLGYMRKERKKGKDGRNNITPPPRCPQGMTLCLSMSTELFFDCASVWFCLHQKLLVILIGNEVLRMLSFWSQAEIFSPEHSTIIKVMELHPDLLSYLETQPVSVSMTTLANSLKHTSNPSLIRALGPIFPEF